MIAGHIGAAAGAKRWAPHVPLWAMMVATFLIDIVFGVLWLFGAEDMSNLEGTDGGYGNMAFNVDWSHSFFGVMFLCLVVLIVCGRYWGAKGGFVLSCVVFSHWFLDMIVHHGDLAMFPGNVGITPRVGLGLWHAPLLAAAVELVLVLSGSWLWYSSADATARTRKAAITTAGVGSLILLLDVTL